MAEKMNIITIDGPSGAGKSTISRLLAARLHFTYLDTGAMYRVVGLQLQRSGLDLETGEAAEKLAQLLDGLHMSLAPGEEGMETRAFLDGEDVSVRIAKTALDVVKATAPTILRDKPDVAVAIGQVSMEQRTLTEGDINDALAHMFEARNGPGSVQRHLGRRAPDA